MDHGLLVLHRRHLGPIPRRHLRCRHLQWMFLAPVAVVVNRQVRLCR
jgi:hypothetical protein